MKEEEMFFKLAKVFQAKEGKSTPKDMLKQKQATTLIELIFASIAVVFVLFTIYR